MIPTIVLKVLAFLMKLQLVVLACMLMTVALTYTTFFVSYLVTTMILNMLVIAIVTLDRLVTVTLGDR